MDPYRLVEVDEISCCVTILDLVGSCKRVGVRVQAVYVSPHGSITHGLFRFYFI